MFGHAQHRADHREAMDWLPAEWRWVSGEGERPSGSRAGSSLLASWRTGQPDARFGREDCAYISVSEGEWSDYACDLREMRCLCELGVHASVEYIESMAAHAEAMNDDAARLRVWAALVVGALLALPHALPLLDTRSKRRADVTDGATEGSTVTDRRREGGGGWRGSHALRQLIMDVSVGLFVCGFAPFFCHHSGVWNAMQLGPWSGYPWMGGIGGFLLIEATPLSHQWAVSFFAAGLFVGIFVTCVMTIWESWANDQDHSPLQLCTFLGFAPLIAYATYLLIFPALQCGRPCDFYRGNYYAGRFTSLSCGLVLFLCMVAPNVHDPSFARQNPYAPGTVLTIITWTALGLFAPPLLPHACTRLLGDASNERRLQVLASLDCNHPCNRLHLGDTSTEQRAPTTKSTQRLLQVQLQHKRDTPTVRKEPALPLRHG